MRVNLAVQCIILLAFMAICSSHRILRCRCLKNSSFVKPSLVAGVQEYGLRPYCTRRELIVTLKDGTKQCLDPQGKFTKALLEKMKQKSGDKMTVNPKTTTAPATVSTAVRKTT